MRPRSPAAEPQGLHGGNAADPWPWGCARTRLHSGPSICSRALATGRVLHGTTQGWRLKVRVPGRVPLPTSCVPLGHKCHLPAAPGCGVRPPQCHHEIMSGKPWESAWQIVGASRILFLSSLLKDQFCRSSTEKLGSRSIWGSMHSGWSSPQAWGTVPAGKARRPGGAPVAPRESAGAQLTQKPSCIPRLGAGMGLQWRVRTGGWGPGCLPVVGGASQGVRGTWASALFSRSVPHLHQGLPLWLFQVPC